MHSVV